MFVQFMHFRRSGWGLNHHLPSLALFFERPDLELCLLGRKRRLFPDLAQEGFCLQGRFTQRGAPFLISTKEKHFLSGNRPGGKEGQKLLQPPREDRAGPREPWWLGGVLSKGAQGDRMSWEESAKVTKFCSHTHHVIEKQLSSHAPHSQTSGNLHADRAVGEQAPSGGRPVLGQLGSTPPVASVERTAWQCCHPVAVVPRNRAVPDAVS